MLVHAMRLLFCFALLATSNAMVTPRKVKLSKIPSNEFVSDAEIKHGRVAMASAAALSALGANGFEHPTAVLSQCPVSAQLLFFSAIGAAEAAFYLPRLAPKFALKESVEPGAIFPRLSAESWLKNSELIVSRATMLMVFLYIVNDVASY
jgi:hypothetical protein